MTRTSKALRRLGVVGLTVATIGAGVPAFFAAPAQAAVPPTALSINPPSQTGTTGTCLNYTVTATDSASQPSAGATITVTLKPDVTPATPVQDVDFCTATNGTSTPAPTAPTNVTNGGVGANDQGTFITDSTGKFTFGIISNQSGTANIQAFYDANGNGSFNAGEPQTQATATFAGGGAPGSNAQADIVRCVDATPEAATNVVGETHSFSVKLTNNSANPNTTGAPGPNVPDSGNSTCGGNVVPGVTPSFTVTGSVSGTNLGPLTCTQSDNTGTSTCSYTRSAAGSDTINVYVNQSGGATGNQDAGEPGDTITKNWIAAQTGNTIAVTCAADNGVTGGTASTPDINGGGSNNSAGGNATCTNQNTDPDRVFVANVKTSGATPTNVQGALVRFTVTTGDGTLGGSTTSQTFDCTTDVSGNCSVLLSDATPVSGEKNTVTAVIRGTSASGSATLTFTNSPNDARNVTLTPKTQNVTPGTGVGAVTALVTDVDGSPVPGVFVTFTESGPGRFVNTAGSSTSVQTDANGKATVEVSALSSESGTQTITADITNGTFGANQCQAAAGKNAAGGTLTGTQANAKAGNCTDTATVTYGAASPTPSGGRRALTLVVNTPLIPAGSTGRLTATGQPNEQFQLMCYTRPSTTYFVARSGAFDTNGNTPTFVLSLGRNTRCFIQYATAPALPSGSVVINVRTVLSLSTVRTGVRTYIFQGRNLPRVAGQLITLYRVDAAGNEIRTTNLITDASGIYRVTRKFTGSGTFLFRVRTSQTLNNAAGVSNTITVRIF